MDLSLKSVKRHVRRRIRNTVTVTASAIALFAAVGTAHASFTWEGGDWGGRDLIPANGDILSGTFTNVGNFIINAGETVYVPGRVWCPLPRMKPS